MSMTAEQADAFQAATGHAPASVSTIVASILVVLFLLWAAWLVARVLSGLRRGDASEADLLFTGLRAAALIWFALYVVQ